MPVEASTINSGRSRGLVCSCMARTFKVCGRRWAEHGGPGSIVAVGSKRGRAICAWGQRRAIELFRLKCNPAEENERTGLHQAWCAESRHRADAVLARTPLAPVRLDYRAPPGHGTCCNVLVWISRRSRSMRDRAPELRRDSHCRTASRAAQTDLGNIKQDECGSGWTGRSHSTPRGCLRC